MTGCGDWVRAVGGEECLHIGAGSDNEWESMSVEAPSVGVGRLCGKRSAGLKRRSLSVVHRSRLCVSLPFFPQMCLSHRRVHCSGLMASCKAARKTNTLGCLPENRCALGAGSKLRLR